jgi:hypothetical protein
VVDPKETVTDPGGLMCGGYGTLTKGKDTKGFTSQQRRHGSVNKAVKFIRGHQYWIHIADIRY